VCPAYNYTLTTLSERHLIELANTAALGYLPVLNDHSDSVTHFCSANAKNHFSVNLQPRLASTYLHNLCQGALSSSTFLEIREAQHLSPQLASLISNFICEAKCLLDKKEMFNLPNGNRNTNIHSFNIALRLPHNADFRPIQEHLRINYRIISLPAISVTAYLNYVCELLFPDYDKDLASRIEKACEIVNKCSGNEILRLEEVRSVLLTSTSLHFG
jgi:hypothetical protein